MFEDVDNFADLFRGGLPYYLLITLPILIICSSSNPVLASSEFHVQRMSQFDVHGVPYGCRASALNLEAKSLYSWSTSRHCIMTRFQELTLDHFRDIRAKAGGLIVLLPENLQTLSLEQRQNIYAVEQAMLLQDIPIPVYFSKFNPELDSIIEDISNIKANATTEEVLNKRDSALSEIINQVSANGYQVVVSGASHAPNKQSKIPVIQGELFPIIKAYTNKHSTQQQIIPADSALYAKLPLIIVTANIDTFGLIHDHLNNVDAAALLTLVDLFSKIYNTAATSPKYRLLFLISESGMLLNFQGIKKWLDSNIEENLALQNVEFVMCLDSIGKSAINENHLYMHVSKPPKDGTHISTFYKILKQNAQRYGNSSVEGVHKKINLADIQLAWEHERFSMKRMPAFTVSNIRSHKDSQRSTIFEASRQETLLNAQQNVKIIAESLANYIYGNGNEAIVNGEINTDASNSEIFSNSMAITTDSIKPWLQTRSSLVNNDLKNAFEKYLKNVKLTHDKPDAREPDFMFYDGQESTLNIYNVKPAVFDLFLTLVIIFYLGTVYFAILYFGHFYSAICKLSNNNNNKLKVN